MNEIGTVVVNVRGKVYLEFGFWLLSLATESGRAEFPPKAPSIYEFSPTFVGQGNMTGQFVVARITSATL